MPARSRRFAAVATLACLAAAGAGCGDDGQDAATPAPGNGDAAEPARFAGLPHGWTQTTSPPATIRPSGASTSTLATSWPYEPDPRGPAAAIPQGELFVSVLLIRRHTRDHQATDLCRRPPSSPAFPPQRHGDLAIDRMTTGHLEGRPGVTEYRLMRSTPDYWVDLRVDVDRRRPGTRTLREADQALRTLLLPDWPNRCAP